MNRRLVSAVGTVLLAALVVTLGSCNLAKTSVEERVADFLRDLNSDTARTSIYKNLHPDIQSAWRDPSTWSGTAFDYGTYQPFGLSGMSYGSSSASGTLARNDGPHGIVFAMKEDSDGWYILSISVDSIPRIF